VIDPGTLGRAAGITPGMAARWAPHVRECIVVGGLGTRERLAMWLAQVGHESAGFSRLVERLNYSAAGLRKTWPARFPDDRTAELYAGKPEAIANRAYADRIGNGPEASGDGWRYRGRGLIQVTGRANYAACGKAIGLDLLRWPERLEEDRLAALSSCWYWEARKLNWFADFDDLEGATKAINGGLNGYSDRAARYKVALAALEGWPQPIDPRDPSWAPVEVRPRLPASPPKPPPSR